MRIYERQSEGRRRTAHRRSNCKRWYYRSVVAWYFRNSIRSALYFFFLRALLVKHVWMQLMSFSSSEALNHFQKPAGNKLKPCWSKNTAAALSDPLRRSHRGSHPSVWRTKSKQRVVLFMLYVWKHPAAEPPLCGLNSSEVKSVPRMKDV